MTSTGGKGETAGLGLTVAKSGRTTGLTCASVSALDLDVNVDYYTDCAETKPYLTKTFTNQLAISGNQFSDAGDLERYPRDLSGDLALCTQAGASVVFCPTVAEMYPSDSGSLVVDTATAEPVGLFFAGGTDASGVSQGVANPATDVLAELASQVGSGATYSFVGTADHGVSCLNYGDNTVTAAQARTLNDAEVTRSQQALAQARTLVNPTAPMPSFKNLPPQKFKAEQYCIGYIHLYSL